MWTSTGVRWEWGEHEWLAAEGIENGEMKTAALKPEHVTKTICLSDWLKNKK